MNILTIDLNIRPINSFKQQYGHMNILFCSKHGHGKYSLCNKSQIQKIYAQLTKRDCLGEREIVSSYQKTPEFMY
jgi:hypothetical protein